MGCSPRGRRVGHDGVTPLHLSLYCLFRHALGKLNYQIYCQKGIFLQHFYLHIQIGVLNYLYF